MEQRFQVNLKGIIELLSHHLYSSPAVYVRELLQNGTDALRARQHLEPGHEGRVRVRVGPGRVEFEDDGVGLTEDEIHRFLATIGESSKREALAERRRDFIGQFGIGLLSCFMVCDELVVRTRSARGDGRTWEWRGRHDGTYRVQPSPEPLPQPGTRVSLVPRGAEGAEACAPERVRALAQHFGGLLPFPILFEEEGRPAVRLNDGVPPWRQQYASARERREALIAYGRALFGLEPLDVVPLRAAAGDVDGVAFVLPFTPHFGTRQPHRVYLKGMLLSEGAEELLPDWAFFVRCVVNANALRPTASREGFYEDEALARTREELGGCLQRYLVALAREAPPLLERLIGLHALSMKALALDDDDFFRLVSPWLTFETSLGAQRLEELTRAGRPLRYVPGLETFRQVARVAAAQGLCVVNAAYTHDAELLEKLGRLSPELDVAPFDATDLPQSFEELTPEERRRVHALREAAAGALAPLGCEAEVKKFLPADLPALYALAADAAFQRELERTREQSDDLYGSLLEDVAQAAPREEPPTLYLNLHNPVVQRLATVREPALRKTLVETLYVQALLLGQRPLRAAELALLNRGLTGLITAALAGGGTHDDDGGEGSLH